MEWVLMDGGGVNSLIGNLGYRDGNVFFADDECCGKYQAP